MIKIKFDKNNNRAIALEADIIIGECNFIENEENWNIIHTFALEDCTKGGVMDAVTPSPERYLKWCI